jgi:hypothetical protein
VVVPLLLVAIAPEEPGTLTLTAEVSAFEADPVLSNNQATEHTTVLDGADLRVEILAPQTTAPLEPITYTIVATSLGPQPVVGARVTANFPAEVLDVAWTCQATSGSHCTPSGQGDLEDFVDLLPGGSVIYTAVGTVAEGAVGSLETTAVIEVPAGLADPDLSNNVSTVTTRVPEPALFRNGFESGDTSGWSVVVGGS